MVRAALGQREQDEGPTVSVSGSERAQARRQALGVASRSVAVGVAATTIVWAFAELLRKV